MSQENSTVNERADIYEVIDVVTRLIPEVKYCQLQVTHPGADDDGLWFFWLPNMPGEVQLESSTGMLPFLAETDKHNNRTTCVTINESAQIVYNWLQLSGGNHTSFWHPR